MSFARMSKLFATAVALSAASMVAASVPATAMPADQRPLPSANLAETSGTPLLEKPASMTTEQWYSTNPFYGLSYATQARYYTNGEWSREMVAKLKAGSATVVYRGVSYTKQNWEDYAAIVASGEHYQVHGLPQWYDADASNDGFLPYDPDAVWMVPVKAEWHRDKIDAGLAYDKESGYNANYFDSLEDQANWFTENGVIVNRVPFPETAPHAPYTDAQIIEAGLYMYSDGNSPAPTSGAWAESWDRVKPADFDPAAGTSPLQPIVWADASPEADDAKKARVKAGKARTAGAYGVAFTRN